MRLTVAKARRDGGKGWFEVRCFIVHKKRWPQRVPSAIFSHEGWHGAGTKGPLHSHCAPAVTPMMLHTVAIKETNVSIRDGFRPASTPATWETHLTISLKPTFKRITLSKRMFSQTTPDKLQRNALSSRLHITATCDFTFQEKDSGRGYKHISVKLLVKVYPKIYCCKQDNKTFGFIRLCPEKCRR